MGMTDALATYLMFRYLKYNSSGISTVTFYASWSFDDDLGSLCDGEGKMH